MALILLFSCTNTSKKSNKISPAFYYWQTNFDLSETEKIYLNALSIKKIYLKFFDVDWNFEGKEAVALATSVVLTDLTANFEIIPTVFITNRTLSNISSNKVTGLADKISQKIIKQLTDFDHQIIKEIQFDCDWTQGTSQKYFQLLKILNKQFQSKKIDLSATIRLHQIKYVQKTGVPPVKRGMLMYYNMGKVQNSATQNSILDNQIGQQYLRKLEEYPLPLDIALPLFRWGVLFRNGRMIKLINQLEEIDLVDSQRFAKQGDNTWKVHKSTYLNTYYLYEGDKIRLESVHLPKLEEAVNLLQSKLKKEDRSIVFYHLDSAVISHFEVTGLKRIVDGF